MLIFIYKYLIIKLKNNKIIIKKIIPYNNLLIKSKYLFYNKYFNLFIINNYFNCKNFFFFILNLFLSNIKPYILTSTYFIFEQIKINNYINFFFKQKINFLYITDKNINSKKIVNFKKKKIPIFIISNKKNNIEYNLYFHDYNFIYEMFFIKLFINLLLFIQKEKKIIHKKNYIYLKLSNIIKKND